MRAVITATGGILALLATSALAQPVVLEDIIISANRTETLAARTGSSVSVLTGAELAPTGEPLALSTLGRLPGVTTQQNGSIVPTPGFAVRGVGAQYVRVLVDGIDIADPTDTQIAPRLGGFLAGDTGRIEVLKGSQSALYGGQAVGGVINITAPRPDRDGISHAVRLEGGSYGTANGSYALGFRGPRADGTVTVSGLRTDGFSAADEADGNTEADGYETSRISTTGTFYATDTVSLFGTLLHQYESGDFDASGGPLGDNPDNYFRTRTNGVLAGIGFAAAGIENRLSFSYFDIDRESFAFNALFEAEGDRSRVDYVGTTTVSDSLSLQFGADWSEERTRFAESDTSSIAGLFAQATWVPTDPLTLTAALRQDEHSEFGGYTTGRATAAYAVTTATTLRGSVGTGFRAPSNFELFAPLDGNPDLDPETSRSWDLGVEHRFAGRRGQISAAIFHLELDELIEYVGAFQPDLSCTGPCQYVQVPGTSTAKGVELGGSYALTDRWRVTGAYTYTDAETAAGERRSRIPAHEISLGVAGEVTDRIALGLSGKLVADVVDSAIEPAPGQVDRVGDYALFDARVGYRLTDAAEAYLRVENLLDEEYQTALGYGTSGRAVFAGVSARF